MKIRHQVVIFDAADLAAESSFWARLLGGTVDAEEDWHMVLVSRQPRVGVQLAPDHVPPEWPDGNPQQIHLDLWVDDFDEAHAEVRSAGARGCCNQRQTHRLRRQLPGLRRPRWSSILPVLDEGH
jgi:Glyoxalase-like domain